MGEEDKPLLNCMLTATGEPSLIDAFRWYKRWTPYLTSVLIFTSYDANASLFQPDLLHCHFDFHSTFILSPIIQPKIVEENLTYAELDLMKPIPEPKASRSGTVYAQILFGEQRL